MKKHLVKFAAHADMDYYTKTYCGLNSDTWSEEFHEKNPLIKNVRECTCGKCLQAFGNEAKKHTNPFND